MAKCRRLGIGAILTLVMMMAACNTLVGLDRAYDIVSPEEADQVASGSLDGAGDTSTTTPPSSDQDSGATPDKDSGAPDTSTVTDGNTPDSTFVPDTGAPDTFVPPPALIHCGSTTQTCTVGTQSCCSIISGGYDCLTPSKCACGPANSCNGVLHLDCDDQTDCAPGLVCCGTLTGDHSTLVKSLCSAPAGCTITSDKVPLCDTSSPSPKCPGAGACNEFISNAFPGVGRCSP